MGALQDCRRAVNRWYASRPTDGTAQHDAAFELVDAFVRLDEQLMRLVGDPVSKLYDVASGGELSALDELVQRAEMRWWCEDCGFMNAGPVCEGCGKPPKGENS